MKTKPADKLYCGCRPKRIANADPELYYDRVSALYHYINERYKIHLFKDVYGQPKPWTQDPVLQSFRFTNIRREHDRETKWVIEHIAKNPELSYNSKLLNMILFRLYNKHETFEILKLPRNFGPGWNPESFRIKFKQALIANPNYIFFTGAFQTGGIKVHCKKYMPSDVEDMIPLRILYLVKHMQTDGVIAKIRAAQTQQDVISALLAYEGLGPFLAYQIFVDFTYIKEFPFSENEYVLAGPGCKMGLNILFKNKDGMTHEECLFWLRNNLDGLFRSNIDYQWDPHKLFVDLNPEDQCFNVMSLENIFCEFSKYIRACEGTGRPRKTYKGGR